MKNPFYNRPCAQAPLTSYRYAGRLGYVMIGATDHKDALKQAQRSIGITALIENLQIWDDASQSYQPVKS